MLGHSAFLLMGGYGRRSAQSSLQIILESRIPAI